MSADTAFKLSDKSAAPRRPKRNKSSAKNQPKFSPHGRPGKRTPQLEKELLAAIETGAPYRIACLAVGISEDAFAEWRRKDPEFARRVEQAAGKTALAIMKRIRKHGEDNFAPLAWILERRFPADYCRPEAQFQINNVDCASHGRSRDQLLEARFGRRNEVVSRWSSTRAQRISVGAQKGEDSGSSSFRISCFGIRKE